MAAVTASGATYDTNDRISGNTFDNNGNTLTSGANSYSYDFEDKLTSVNGGAIAMVYDGDGNRVSKIVGGLTTRYLVNDSQPDRICAGCGRVDGRSRPAAVHARKIAY